jgi:hypothetical protein
MIRVFAFVLALVSGLAIGEARADASCDALFATLRDTAAKSRNHIQVLWTTNYYAPGSETRFTGTTRLNLIWGHGDLAGSSVRRQMVFGNEVPAKPPTERSDNVILRLRADGRVMLNDRYGPFDPVCSQNKFAVVSSGDSIETFSFRPVDIARQILESGEGVTFVEKPPSPPSAGPGGGQTPPPQGPLPPPKNDWERCAESAIDGVERYIEIAGHKYKCAGRIVVADVKELEKRGYRLNPAHAYFTGRLIHLSSAGIVSLSWKHDLRRYLIVVENWADATRCSVKVSYLDHDLHSPPPWDWRDTMDRLFLTATYRWYRAGGFSHCKNAIADAFHWLK